MAEVLFTDSHHRIEFHPCGGPARQLVCSFTSLAFTDLNAPGFGQKFLLDHGHDVLAFKCDNGTWFQGLEAEVVARVGQRAQAYDSVATYGSSMGGFAAIAFSRALQATLVLAISPQFSPVADFEPRWRHRTDAITFRHLIMPQTLAPKARYKVLYDNRFDLDVRQMDLLAQVLPPETTEMIGIPFSSHHTIIFLAETGQLGGIVAAILRGEEMPPVDYRWSKVSRSADFLQALALHARAKGHIRLARLCLERGLKLRPQEANFTRLLNELPK